MRKTFFAFLAPRGVALGTLVRPGECTRYRRLGIGDTFTVNFNGSDDDINTSTDPWLTSNALFLVQAYSDQLVDPEGHGGEHDAVRLMNRIVTGTLASTSIPSATSADVTGILHD